MPRRPAAAEQAVRALGHVAARAGREQVGVGGAGLRGRQGRPGDYEYVPPLEADTGHLAARIREEADRAWALYLELTEQGVAPEQARFWLPQGTLTRLYATDSYRNWLSWLVQRNDPHAQLETRLIAEQVEAIVAQCIPITYGLWESHGRRLM